MRSLEESERDENAVARGGGEAGNAQGGFDVDGIGILVPAGHAGDFEGRTGRKNRFHFVGDVFFFSGVVVFLRSSWRISEPH